MYANPALPAGTVDRDGWVLCVLEQLRTALRRRDVYAAPSTGGPTRAPNCWPGSGCRVERHLTDLTTTLDAAWRQLA